MAVDVSKIPNNSKFDPVREAILKLQKDVQEGVSGVATVNSSDGNIIITDSGNITVSTVNETITIGIDDSTYLTEEVNDLTAAVTWANVPDANITQSSVTQHQAALSITESQISDLGSYIELTDLSVTTSATPSAGGALSYDNTTGVFTFTPADAGTGLTLQQVTANGNTTTYGISTGNITVQPSGTGSGIVTIQANSVGDARVDLTPGSTAGDGVIRTTIERGISFEPFNTEKVFIASDGNMNIYEKLAVGKTTAASTYHLEVDGTALAHNFITSMTASGTTYTGTVSQYYNALQIRTATGGTISIGGSGPMSVQNNVAIKDGNLDVNGDVTANFFIGDGSQLTNIAGTAQDLQDVTDNGATTTNSITVNNTLKSYSSIGASDNVRTGLAHYDTTSQAAGVGGQLVLGYKYISDTNYTEGAILKTYKENSTSGHYGSGLKIQVRNHGEDLATKMRLSPSGYLLVGGDRDAYGTLEVLQEVVNSAGFWIDANTTNRSRLETLVTTNYTRLQSYGMGTSLGNISINPLGNNTGVGTTDPAHKLHVKGDFGVNNGSFFLGDTTDTDSGIQFYKSGSEVRIYRNEGSFGGTYTAENVSLELYSGSTYATKINGNGISFFNGGNVAIGATSSSSKLTVASGTPTGATTINTHTVIAIDSAANQYLEFRTSSASTGIMQGILFTDNGQNAFVGYREYTGGTAGTYGEALHLAYKDFSASDSNNGIYFGTSATPSNGVSNVQMFIKGNGNVGIGTDSPNAKLEVNGRIRLTNSTTEIYNQSSRIRVRAESTDNVAQFADYGMYLPITGKAYNLYVAGSLNIGHNERGKVKIGSSDQDRILFDSDGTSYLVNPLAVGATSVPSNFKFHVTSSTMAGNFVAGNGGYTALRFDGSNGATIGSITTVNGSVLIGSENSGGTGSNGEIQIQPSSGDAALFIDSSKRVGIGTTSPSEKLEVGGNVKINSNTGVRINSYTSLGTTASGAMSILGHNVHVDSANNRVVASNTGYFAQWIKMYYNQGISFHTSNTTVTSGVTMLDGVGANAYERMRITNGGDVGIGTDSPIDKLHVAGGITSTSIANVSNGAITSIQMGADGTNGIIRTWNSSPMLFQAYNFFRFDVSGSAAMTISTSRNVGIGTTSPNHKLDVNGRIRGVGSIRVDGGATDSPYFGLYQNGVEKGYLQYIDLGDNLRMQSDGVISFMVGTTEGGYFNSSGHLYFNQDLRNNNQSLGGDILNIRGRSNGQYIRMMGGENGFGIVDSGWSSTMHFRNMNAYGHIYHNGGSPIQIGNGTDQFVKLTGQLKLGVFSQSQTNTGDAWFGRAGDRAAGSATIQLGTNTSSKFEIVDYSWSNVLFEVNHIGDLYAKRTITSAANAVYSNNYYNSTGSNWIEPAGTSNIINLKLRSNANFDIYDSTNASFIHCDARPESDFSAAYKYSWKTGGGYGYYREYWWDGNSYQSIAQIDDSFRFSCDVIAFASSDKRLKENIKPIENALDKVKSIGGYEFDWNDKQRTYEGHDIGVIAQEVEQIVPEVVTTREDGYKAVKYEKLVPILIEAIKEQQKQIDELKARLDA